MPRSIPPLPASIRAVVALLVLVAIGLPASAQRPAECEPQIGVLAPDPVPDPYPADALAPPPGSHAGRARREPRHNPEPAQVLRGRDGGCATEIRDRDWDGTDWEADHARETATYDDTGRPLVAAYFLDLGAGLALNRHVTNTYDADGRMSERLYQTLAGGALVPSSRSTNTFGADGRLLGSQIDVWTGTSWQMQNRNMVEYGDGPFPYATASRYERWTGTAWEPLWQSAYAYDAEGRRQVFTVERWVAGAWAPYERKTYVYDAAGRLASYTTDEPDGPTAWEPDYRTVYTYGADGRLTEARDQEWGGSTWFYNYVMAYTYDADGRLSTEVLSDDEEGPLRFTFRHRYAYADGRLTEIGYDRREAGAWDVSNRALFTRDVEGRLTERLAQYWAFQTATWINSYSTLFAYDGTVSADAEPPGRTVSLSVAPNPAARGATLHYEISTSSAVRLVVTDVLGRTVATVAAGTRTAGRHAVPLDVRRLAPGVYVARLDAGGAVASHPFTVLH